MDGADEGLCGQMMVTLRHECLCLSLTLSVVSLFLSDFSVLNPFLVSVWVSGSVSIYVPAFHLLVAHRPPTLLCSLGPTALTMRTEEAGRRGGGCRAGSGLLAAQTCLRSGR